MEFDLENAGSGLEQQNLEGTEIGEAASLEPKLMDVPGMGEVLVGGDPYGIADQLDCEQGDNVLNAGGDCGLVSVANIAVEAGLNVTEDEVVILAVGNGLCEYSTELDSAENGGTNAWNQSILLGALGIPSTVFSDLDGSKLNPNQIADYVESGHGVAIHINAGYAWNDAAAIDDGSVNHSVTVTGTVRDPETNELKGLIVCDSGVPGNTSAVVLDLNTLQDAYTNAEGSCAIITDQPVRA